MSLGMRSAYRFKAAKQTPPPPAEPPSTLNYPANNSPAYSTTSSSWLPEHIHLSAHQIAPKRDAGRAKVSRLRTKRVKPAALFDFDGEIVCRSDVRSGRWNSASPGCYT